MADIWFTSDTHFFHTNIIKYCDRPFYSVEEMNEIMVQRWNAVVKPQDKVWHLGDVAMKCTDKQLNSLLKRLNGHKRLTVGNHDNVKSPAIQNNFEKIELWYGNKDWGITFSHIPQLLDHLRDGMFNGHGHIHTNMMEDKQYINLCVEHRNYMPTHLDQIRLEMRNV